jgi:Acyl carrier protein
MKQMDNCLERVIKAIRECKRTKAVITAESLLSEDLDIDSFDILMLIGELEEEFDITIEEDQLGGVIAVGDIVSKLEELSC